MAPIAASATAIAASGGRTAMPIEMVATIFKTKITAQIAGTMRDTTSDANPPNRSPRSKLFGAVSSASG